MTRVRVLFFAAARDVVGFAEEQRELPDNIATVGDFALHMARVHAALAPAMGHLRVARNERFADPAERIVDGDVLALLPPVAGG